MYLLGDFMWVTAVALQLVEALNIGHEAQVQEWEARGHYGAKPRHVPPLYRASTALCMCNVVRGFHDDNVADAWGIDRGKHVAKRVFKKMHPHWRCVPDRAAAPQ